MTIRARFDGVAFIPVDRVDLAKDQLVELIVIESTVPPRGSPAAVLRAMHSTPHIPKEDLDELERMIEEGKRAIRYEGIFDDLGPE
jgi:hypothetical protein